MRPLGQGAFAMTCYDCNESDVKRTSVLFCCLKPDDFIHDTRKQRAEVFVLDFPIHTTRLGCPHFKIKKKVLEEIGEYYPAISDQPVSSTINVLTT